MLDPGKFKHELKLQGITIQDLSARSGLNYSHLSNMKNGKIKDVKFETILVLASFLNNIPPYRLLKDSVLQVAKTELIESITNLPREKWIPYIEAALGQGAATPDITNKYPLIGAILPGGKHSLPVQIPQQDLSSCQRLYLPIDQDKDPGSYAVEVSDILLEPDIPRGSILVFSPAAHIVDNALCLVKEKVSGLAWLRYIYYIGPTKTYQLYSNKREPIVLAESDVEFAHRCIARFKIEDF